jgi:hypothetical protein
MREALQIIGLSLLGVVVTCLMFGLIFLGNNIAGSGQRMYNCSIAEISPDFTSRMREECRQLRREHNDTSR